MSLIWTPQRRTSQPQGAGNAAHRLLAPRSLVVTQPGAALLNSTAPPSSAAYRQGLALSFNGSTQYVKAINGASGFGTTGVTAFILIMSPTTFGATDAVRSPIDRKTATTGFSPLNFSWSHVSSSYAGAWASHNGISAWTPLKYTSGVSAGQWVLLSASIAPGVTNGYRSYIDGRLAASTTVSKYASHTGHIYVGCATDLSDSTVGFLDSRIALAGYVDSAWSDADHASFAANPWQLFAPQRQIIPYGAAASSLPTLSAPQMTGITSTGGYPRVSYEY